MLTSAQISNWTPETQQQRTKKASAAESCEFASFLYNYDTQTIRSKPFDLSFAGTQVETPASDKGGKAESTGTTEKTLQVRAQQDTTTSRSESDSPADSQQSSGPSAEAKQKTSGTATSYSSQKSESLEAPQAENKMIEDIINVQQAAGVTEGSGGAESRPTDAQNSSGAFNEIQQLIRQIAGQSVDNSQATGKNDLTQIKAKVIESSKSIVPQHMGLTDQKIVFETGLAEHFVRLLTDQYDQIKKSSGEKSSDTGGSLPVISSLSSETAKTLTHVVQAPTEIRTTPDTAAENMNRIVQIIRSNLGQRQSQITVQLDPPELGKMRVDLKLIDNNLQLSIATETDHARQMLSDRVETLRSSLEQNGISLSKCEIIPRTASAQSDQKLPQFQDSPARQGSGFAQQNSHQRQNDNSSQTSAGEETQSVVLPPGQAEEEILNMVA